jgi:predicted enzyme related to lactoylglutathione lyase
MIVKGIQTVGLYVRDFQAALHFYRDTLGIPLQVDGHGDYHHADYSFQNPYFHFAIFPAEPKGTAVPTHLSFQVEDCHQAFDRAVRAGAIVRRAPQLMSYSGGGLSAEVFDPDGNEVELFQPASSN